ncbi:hypothetical protein GWK47_042433 [Chionoecetes opilio]|uniref:Uncharacterized protein n=1 Tax=Chionoecetes opilio TaxID=41210 RepID=A0A8J4Y949_CHIOP|nr:hypothetical protein GWK47_042433 [Chionoecetes opilio]
MCGSYYDLLVNKETSREHAEVNVQVGDDGDVEFRGQDVVVAVKLFTGFLRRGTLVSPSIFAALSPQRTCPYHIQVALKGEGDGVCTVRLHQAQGRSSRRSCHPWGGRRQLATLRCVNNHFFLGEDAHKRFGDVRRSHKDPYVDISRQHGSKKTLPPAPTQAFSCQKRRSRLIE